MGKKMNTINSTDLTIDKREYTVQYPTTNSIITTSMRIIDGTDNMQSLEFLLDTQLQKNNDALINVALNLAPSQAVASLIYNTMHKVINNGFDDMGNENSGSSSIKYQIIAIPIIIVAGSNEQKIITSFLNNRDIDDFISTNNIFAPQTKWYISNKLINPESISHFTPSQIYHWIRSDKFKNDKFPFALTSEDINVASHGVFSRLLLGKIEYEGEVSIHNIINFDNYQKYSNLLMKIIIDNLKTNDVTLFPIPFPPCYLSISFVNISNYHKEISLSVNMSNVMRKIRLNNLTPIAIIETMPHGVQITIMSKNNDIYKEIQLWALNNYDDINYVIDIITGLLKDLQVEYKIFCA